MNTGFLLIGTVILIYILMSRFLEKIPIPSLLFFIALGICFGENGLLHISFDDYVAVNLICSASLVFIMFYGGFGTNLKAARPVVVQSVVLSTLGVAGTAAAVGVFAHVFLGFSWTESMLVGSVISSTDAASVFNILRSKKLALKNNTDSLLEIESGSNDPVSYMLTTVAIAIMAGQEISIPWLLLKQIAAGILGGILIAKLVIWLLGKNLLISQQARTVFLFGSMLMAYAVPSVFGGNGYLSVYLCGIIIGNSNLSHKKYLVHFFDVVTDVAQVVIFFLLGLLVTPIQLPTVIFPALAVMLFLTIVARPAVVSILLLPFRASVGQVGVTAWSGLRGAASIVFAISAVLSGIETKYNLFNLVFCIVIFSLLIQGTLLPWVAEKLSMIDATADISKTFNDYQEESEIDFIKIQLHSRHPWCGHTVSQLSLPLDLRIVMVLRESNTIIPHGGTCLMEGDLLVMAAYSFEERDNLRLCEMAIDRGHKMANKPIAEISGSKKYLIILIRRGTETIIPTGRTVILPGDVLVLAESDFQKAKVAVQ